MFAFAAQFTHSFTDTLCVIAVITYSMSSMKNRRKLQRKKEYFFPQRGFQLIKFKETDSLFFFPRSFQCAPLRYVHTQTHVSKLKTFFSIYLLLVFSLSAYHQSRKVFTPFQAFTNLARPTHSFSLSILSNQVCIV